ncbi:MAG: alkaline phosphatase family protein [Anaerolineales bacterium]
MRTIIVGFDAFDPAAFERLHAQGKLPNLGRYVQSDGYRHFTVANPAQSEVSWTSIATGLSPGGHGLFDFVHRNPDTYALNVSLLPTKQGRFGTEFVPPYTAQTIFDQAIDDGYPATVLWWPAMFPARLESPVRTIPGLGVPDIQGRLGVGFLFAPEPEWKEGERKTQFAQLQRRGKGAYSGFLKGPIRKTRSGAQESTLEIQLEVLDDQSARLKVGKQSIDLAVGKWSPILEISFKLGFLISVQAITRVILTRTQPEPRLYTLPLQIHPLRSPWRYATPPGFVKKTWNTFGPFLTLGWPQDTTGLEEDCISDDQFLALCDSIFETRKRIFLHHLQHFREGVLANVFDTLDRVQHMFWRDRPDVIRAWYVKLDALVSEIESQVGGSTRLLFVSDHGFANFEHKIHLNRWLVEGGYLAPKDAGGAGSFRNVDWSKSRAYAIGLNSLYLNLAGREGQGTVTSGEKENVLNQLRESLLKWQGPDGRAVVQGALTQKDAFDGPLAEYGPDLVVGFAPGYRASAQTGLGGWESTPIEPNRDHWGADHCMDPASVKGVLFSNRGLKDFPEPSYRDFPVLAIGKMPSDSTHPHSKGPVSPPTSSDEDQDAVEERLKGLGYL